MTDSPPRLALFDLDNTLIDRAAAFRLWASAFLAGRSLGGEREVDWLCEADRDGLTPRPLLFEQVRSRYRLADGVEDLVAAYRRDYPQHVPPLEEETLTALHDLRARGWKVGIVSNGPPTQEAKIVAAGLIEVVDGWAISEVVGAAKPEPAIFRAAAAACGCKLDGTWVVGDSARADIGGAVACGLPSIWISRGREWEIDEFKPDAITETVAQTITYILAASQSSTSQ
jgi:putative hydrolase of the HAD superfamily